MNILLLDSFSLNSGDEAILVSTVQEINRIFRHPTISIEVSHPEVSGLNKSLRLHVLYPRIIDIQKIFVSTKKSEIIGSLMLGLFDYGCFLMWSFFSSFGISAMWCIRPEKRGYATALQDADIVISVGGGFLNTHYNYFLRFLMYMLVVFHRKPLHFMAQSIGPFHNRMSIICMKYFLRYAATVSVREPVSYTYLTGIGVSKHILTADIANALSTVARSNLSKKNKPLIAICLKNCANKAAEDRYERAIVNFIQDRIHDGYSIVLTCHTVTDNDMAKRLIHVFGKNVTSMFFRSDPKELKRIYGQCFYVVAARMHAIIFCSSMSIPFIAVAYEPKFYGLIHQLHYDHSLIVSYQDVTGQTLSRMATYIEKNRSRLHDALDAVRTGQLNAARLNVSYIREHMGSIT